MDTNKPYYITGASDCCENSRDDIITNRQKLYSEKNKVIQDNKLSHLITVNTPKRRRSRNEGNSHQVSIRYQVWTSKGSVSVCQKFFMAALGVTQRRILTIAKCMNARLSIKERRGGDRKSHKHMHKKKKVRAFISKLRGRKSHYNRAKSQRIYLSSEMNIAKLHKLYNETTTTECRVNYNFFKRIFTKDFNTGFESPACDTCSFCTRQKNRVSMAHDEKKKQSLMMQLRMHKMRASAFYDIMKESHEDSVSFCFDLQQVQVLPKIPIQEAYYAR